jgi:predicted dehydrogenase
MHNLSDSPYRAGVIGLGAIGSSIEDDIRDLSIRMGLPYGHASVHRAVSRTTLVAAADIDAARRASFADRWGLHQSKIYSDYREMLANENLDVVSIATPTPLHAEMALAAVEARVRGIFLEKPIAASLADAQHVVSACKQAGIQLAVNHTRRGDPVYRRARRLIDDGAIGALHSLVAHFGGGLMWIGTHTFDMLNYLNGDRPAAWIIGHLDDPAGFDPGGSAYVFYENGVRGFINGSTGHAVGFRIEAFGSEGKIVVGNHDLELWRSNPDKSRYELLRYPFPLVMTAEAPMVVLLEELLDAMEEGVPMVSDGQTALRALELIIGLYSSSNDHHQPIRLPMTDRDLTIASH